MVNGKFEIEILFYKDYNAMVSNITKDTITINNYNNTSTNELNINLSNGPSIIGDIVAENMVNYKCVLTIKNLDFGTIKRLKMTPYDALNNNMKSKFIKYNIFCFTHDNKKIKAFTGQQTLGQPFLTINGNSAKITLQPTFYLEKKPMQLTIIPPATNKQLKQQIANFYKLTLQSYSDNDNKQIKNPISELIDNPINWLRARYTNEEVYATNNSLFFVEKGKTINSFIKNTTQELNETNGLFFIDQIMPNLYECRCAFLPQYSLLDAVKITCLSHLNKIIVNGSIMGKITNIRHHFEFATNKINVANTIFRIQVYK